MDVKCIFCGLCIDSCPYEIISEKYSLRSRFSLIKEIEYLNYNEKALKYILNCVFCGRCVDSCPLETNILNVLKGLFKEEERIRNLIIRYVNKNIQYPDDVKKSDILILINKYYSSSKSEYYKNIINLLGDQGCVTTYMFSDPLHIRYFYNIKLDAFENILHKLLKLSNHVKVLISLDEYTSYFLPLISDHAINISSITEYLSNLLKEGTMIINRDISGAAILTVPIIKSVEDVTTKYTSYILNFMPNIIVKGQFPIMDIPTPYYNLDYELILYKAFLRNIKQDFHFLLSTSSYFIERISKLSGELLFVPVYLPSLIPQISMLC